MSFKLSVELTGHTNDVRVVSSCALDGKEAIITASRDGTARVWNKINVLEYEVVKILTGHNGPVTSLCIMPADEMVGRDKSKTKHVIPFLLFWVPLAYIVTGGQDAKIIVHDMNLDGMLMGMNWLC